MVISLALILLVPGIVKIVTTNQQCYYYYYYYCYYYYYDYYYYYYYYYYYHYHFTRNLPEAKKSFSDEVLKEWNEAVGAKDCSSREFGIRKLVKSLRRYFCTKS